MPGTIADELGFSFPDNAILSTASLNPSAAAKVIQSLSISTFTPISTGLESSEAATKATLPRDFFNSFEEIEIVGDSEVSGIGGNSSDGVPEIRPLKVLHTISTAALSLDFFTSTFSPLGNEFIKSVNILAGNVSEPPSDTSAETHVLIAISRLVAVIFNFESSASIKTF